MGVEVLDPYGAREDQKAVHESASRFVGLGGEKGGGKSACACREMFDLCMQFPGNRAFIFRQKRDDLINNTLPTLLQVIPKEAITKHTWGRIELRNGSVILYSGLAGNIYFNKEAIRRAAESMKGLELGAFMIDEASQTSREFWDALTMTFRWVPKRVPKEEMFYRGVATCNPEPGWFHDLFYRPFIEGRLLPGYSFHHLRAKDNPYLPDDYFESFASMPESWRRRYVHGLWEFDQESGLWVYPTALVTAAMGRVWTPPEGEVIRPTYGLDPAREGKDEATLGKKKGLRYSLWAFTKMKTGELRDNVAAVVKEDPGVIAVDVHGLGVGVRDNLEEMGFEIWDVNLNETPIRDDKYANKRTELFWSFREQLEETGADLSFGGSGDEVLRKEMVAMKYGFDKAQRLQVESKDEYRKRVGRSPGRIEALTYANARSLYGMEWIARRVR